MRHALTLALQLYKGALLVISHDRHLLKNTVDQFYLVAHGKAELFNGDLQEYQDWLRNALRNKEDQKTGIDTPPSEKICDENVKKIDKKQLRKKEAAKREKLKPLTNAIKKIEKETSRAWR